MIYIDSDLIERPIHKLSSFLQRDKEKSLTLRVGLTSVGYLYFEHLVWKKFKHKLHDGEYDIVHRLSPMSPTTPSFLAKRCPIPFILGPILGGLKWPRQFRAEMHREGEWLNYFRPAHRRLPFYQSTYQNSDAILAAYPHTISDVPNYALNKVIEFSEGGVWTKDFPLKTKSSHEKKKILFVGRMVPFKQPELLIQCFIQSKKLQQHELIMVGDGPELGRLKDLVEQNKLEHIIHLTGNVSFEKVKKLMYESDIFAFPSIREQGGGVITLASMCQLPSIVIDYGGPATRVVNNGGIKLAMADSETLTQNYINTLEQLVDQPEKLYNMGLKARQFTSQYYDWNTKAEKTLEIYQWTLGHRTEKPIFWENPQTPSVKV